MKLHKNFRLNGQSFQSVEELIVFSETISEGFSFFLKEWFSTSKVVFVQTSGSTGIPKEISLAKKHMVNSALATGKYFNLFENTKALLCLSTDYIAGKMMLVRALVLGWDLSVVLVNGNPLEETLQNFDFAAMIPLQLQNSLPYLYRVQKIIVGGGVVSEKLQQSIQKKNTQIFATYGMTETITHIAVKKLNHPAEIIQNAPYQVLPNVAISLDERGCLVIDAPLVSNEKIVTNDLVHLINENSFEWLGRFDSIINSGGVKLIPEQIEKKISSSINNRFFVASLPDAYLGEKLILVVEANQKVLSEKDDIKKFLKSSSLHKYEFPKAVYFIPQFVETENNKIQRKKTLDLLLNN